MLLMFSRSTAAPAHSHAIWHLRAAAQDIAPREASVWFQMGRIYKRLDQPDQALAHFCTALDLKPSAADANLIKAAIEKLRVSDESEEEEI